MEGVIKTCVDDIVRWQRLGGHGLTRGHLHLSLSHPTSACVPLPSSHRKVSHRTPSMGLCLTLHITAKGPRTETYTQRARVDLPPLRLILSGICYSGSGRPVYSSSPKVATTWPSGFMSCGYYNKEPQAKPRGLKQGTVILQL